MPRSSQPGLHDPYWYEAIAGLRYVVDLLDPQTGIVGVTFQQPAVEGLDDIVVAHVEGQRTGVQVKYTRVDALFTFNDLVRATEGVSLLRKMVRGWKQLSADGVDCTTRLFSNRRLSQEAGTSQPALGAFWQVMSATVVSAESVASITPPAEFETAWATWLCELDELDDAEKLRFLKTLRIDGGQPDLAGLEAEVIERLTQIFGNIPPSVAEQLFDRLVRSLLTWTTSRRQSSASIEVRVEDACTAIGVPHEETIGDHEFPPPAPFFPSRMSFVKDLALDVRNAPERVTFLTGPAGCGKTSIVSVLANSADPAVDLRFYAFRPISPTSSTLSQDYSRTATASALWGDLLTQLRTRYFVGRLHDAGVPVRNDLLGDDPARLRAHVLRLAAKLSEERGQSTVIAIDGLDHAARGRTLAPEQLHNRPSLLDWLVPPSEVPDGVRFLIAGQPQYERYPPWLRNRTGVRVLDVPPIATEDIEALLQRDHGQLPPDQVPRAAATIAELSRGNTLAAVYAAVEAWSAADAIALRTQLETRQLQDGLDEYYERIWRAAIEPLQTNVPSVGSLLAAALSLSSARLTGALLRDFYPDAAFAAADWEQAFRALAPVIEERNGTFAVRHNDVRVYLTGKLQAVPGAYATAASSIADYYLRADASPAKFADLVRTLSFANRHAELPGVFTPSYVVEAWTVERPISELLDQAEQVLAAVGPDTGWETLHEFALGLRTLQQLRAALQWLEDAGPPSPIPACLPSEARPTPRHGWTVAAVHGVLRDAMRLANAVEIFRARDLVRRWFAELSPVEILAEIKQHPGDLNPMEQRDLDETLNEIARAFGRLSQHIGVHRGILRASVDGDAGTTMAHFFGGWLTAGVTAARPWSQTLRLPRVWFFRDVEEAVRALARADRWEDVALTLRHAAADRAKHLPRFQIAAAPWALRTGDADVIAVWAQPVAEGGFALASAVQYSFQDEDIQLYDAIAFTLGWLEPARPAGAISEEGAAAYFERRSYESGEAAMRRHLYATAMVARLERAAAANSSNLGNAVRADELAAIVRAFFVADSDFGHEVTPFVRRQSTRLLARILAIVARQEDVAYDDAVVPTVLERAAELPYDTFLEVLWNAAAERGRDDLLRGWVLRWVGPEGEAWRMDLGERRDAMQRFAPLARGAGLGDLALAAETRFRRSQVGYVGRKEYALAVPLEWFDMAARDDPAVWEDEGLRLLSISGVATEGGDNRMAVRVEGAVTAAAARSGPASLWRCLMGLAAEHDPPLALAHVSAVDGIIAALEGTQAAGVELRTMWCIGVGCLVWEYERHRLSLQHLRQALLAVAAGRGDAVLPQTLAAVAPRAFEITGNDGLYRYADRWFETRESTEPPPYLRGAAALIGDLRALSLDDSVSRLEAVASEVLKDHMGSSSDLWRAVADTAERLAEARPANFRGLLSRLIAITRLRTEPYSWTFDSVERAFTALIPLMTDAERWALCDWMIKTIMTDDAREFWAESAAANLASLCGIRATADTAAERRSGLRREIAAQETWILGPDRAGRPKWPLVTAAAADDATPQTWGAFGLRGLTQLVSGAGGSHRVQAALRGLFALCVNDPSLVDGLVAEWERVAEERRELLLLLGERLVIELPDATDALRDLFERTIAAGAGRQRLQAVVGLHAAGRVRDDVDAPFELPPPTDHSHPLRAIGQGLIEVRQEMQGAIPLTRGSSAVRQAIQQLASALDFNSDAVERVVAALVGPMASSAPARRKHTDALDGEMLLTPSTALDTFVSWAVEESAAGCFGDLDLDRVAQALLNTDDPWVLTRPTTGLAGPWPVDDELKSLLSEERGRLIDALTAQVNAGLATGERVAAAVLHTFNRETDVVFFLETRWVREIASLSNLRRPTTFNGRTFTYYADDPFEPASSDSAGWLTLRTGGQGLIFHGSVPLTPNIGLWQQFGWSPRPTDPFTWETGDGAEVARLEIWNGPVREAVQDRLYRQPILYRWVVKESAWQDAECTLGATFRTMSDFETHPSR